MACPPRAFREELSNGNAVRHNIMNASHLRNFKFSNNHVNKSKKKWVKLILILNLFNQTYLNYYNFNFNYLILIYNTVFKNEIFCIYILGKYSQCVVYFHLSNIFIWRSHIFYPAVTSA